MSDPLLFLMLNTPALKAVLGTDLRLHIAGDVPQSPVAPYATFQLVSDVPDNNLINNASSSRYTMQIDVWAKSQSQARTIAALIRRTLRPHAYMTFKLEDFDKDTDLKRTSQTFDFMINPN